MFSTVAKRFYDLSPAMLQTLMVNAYAVNVHLERYGSRFRDIKEKLNQTQYYDRVEIEQFQDLQLRALIKHAYETTPYYREVFDKLSLKPSDIEGRKDLHKIPILTREDVRHNLHRLISRTVRIKDLVHGHTSGTTGSPLEFYWDINTCVYSNAVDWRQKEWAGVRYRDPLALLLGRTVVPPGTTDPPFWRMNYLHNQLWLSSFHLKPDYMRHYMKKLDRFQPVAIEGYPSTVYILAQMYLLNNMTFPLKAVFTSSETLYPVQREVIEKAFECKVFDFYGMAERVLFATECSAHRGRHLNFEFGLTEAVDKHGLPVEDGRLGTIVSTSLQNFGMPLIRYKTSDVTRISREICSCGRQMPLVDDVTTKAEDIVVAPDGRMISPSILTHPFKSVGTIAKSQILQHDLENITIKIVKREGYSELDTVNLLRGFSERVGHQVKVHIEFVDDIPRTSSGKFRWVISKVPLRFDLAGP